MQSLIYIFNETILFIGRIPPNQLHANPVDTLATNLDANYLVHDADNGAPAHAQSLYWPGAMPRKTEYDSEDVLSYFMFPKHLSVATLLRQRMQWSLKGGELGVGIEQQTAWVALLKKIYQERPETGVVKQRLNQFFGMPDDHDLFSADCRQADCRVTKALQLIKEELIYNSDKNYAEVVGLSEQHLRRLFRDYVGTSLGRYKIHLRMLILVVLKARGMNFTDSAVGVGFYDLSHSEKTHKSTFGISQANTLSVSELKVDDGVGADVFSITDRKLSR